MQASKLALTPTDIASLTYCPRLFYLNKTQPYHAGSPTFPLVWGNFEHEFFRLIVNKFDNSWRRNTEKSLLEQSQSDITHTVQHVYKLAIENYPSFAGDLKRNVPDFLFRVNLWIKQKQKLLSKIINDGFSKDNAISMILPWKTEDKLFSDKLGLYGRVDAIYNDGRNLIPEDIKTHTNRFKTLLQHEPHKSQLLCYSILLEERYGLPSTRARILYTQDISYVSFKATVTAKNKIIKKISRAREIIDDEIPPLLTGQESIKCKHCYAKHRCMELAKEQGIINSNSTNYDRINELNLEDKSNHGN